MKIGNKSDRLFANNQDWKVIKERLIMINLNNIICHYHPKILLKHKFADESPIMRMKRNMTDLLP